MDNKYDNLDSRCHHPKYGDSVDYCWAFAQHVVDSGMDLETFVNEHCANHNCEYYYPKLSKDELDEVVRIAELDLHTLDKHTIESNPERLERPKLAIRLLKEELRRVREELDELRDPSNFDLIDLDRD